MDLSQLLNTGVLIEVAGKTLKARGLTMDEIAELKAYYRAEALRAWRLSCQNDPTITMAERSKTNMQIACAPVMMSDLFPQSELTMLDEVAICPQCKSIDIRCTAAMHYCPTCRYQKVGAADGDPTMQLRAMWIMMRDQDQDFKQFSGFEKWLNSLSPADRIQYQSVVAGISSDGESGDEENPTKPIPTGTP